LSQRETVASTIDSPSGGTLMDDIRQYGCGETGRESKPTQYRAGTPTAGARRRGRAASGELLAHTAICGAYQGDYPP
jgi:hypothetical protein